MSALVYYYWSVDRPLNTVLSIKNPNSQNGCLLGYRCVPGVTIFDTFFDTFLHLFNAKTGTINSAINSNLYALDKEFNSTPFHSHEFSNWALFVPQLSC